MPGLNSVITVFGSARVRRGSAEYEEALQLGRSLAESGLAICSGGYGGVMEAVSRGASEAGGEVIGVTSRVFRSKANPWVASECRVGNWQERLFELVRRGQGYVACPGGTGTLVELAVVWEMLNKGIMRAKPLVVLGPFWLPVIERVEQAETMRGAAGVADGDRAVYHAGTPGDAARYLAGRLAQGRAGKSPARG
jgi:uncharacterized protein (TIGR00725 family)